MIKSSLSLYRTLNDEMLQDLSIDIMSTAFSYNDQNELTELTFDQEELNKFYLGTVPEFWEPNENNLIVERELRLNKIEILFGEKGIANKATTLGVAAKIHSRSSDFSQTFDLNCELKVSDSQKIIKFKHEFEKSTLRGNIYIEIFLFNKYTPKYNLDFANENGTNLGVIDGLEIVVDGDGSTFPIVEVKKSGEPLWKLVMNWNDLNNEAFEQENVRLEINIKHQMYDYIFQDRKPSRMMLFEIMSNVMSQITYSAINDPLFDPSSSEEQSIASVVMYWVQVYNIDTSTFESISYSLRRNLENEMVG